VGKRKGALRNWIVGLLKKPARLVTVALANKLARILWAMMKTGESFRTEMFAGYRARAEKAGRNAARVIAIYEAGWSGFWLVRWLAKYGIETHVIQPSSVPVDRRVRRAKSDGIDADLLLRTLLAWLRGEPRVCSMVPIPTERPMKTPAAGCESGRNSLQSGSAWSIASAPSWRLWALAYTTHHGGIGANVLRKDGIRWT
jgi:transposase